MRVAHVVLGTWLAGCSGDGDYEVRWTIGAAAAAERCSPSGLDSVILDWVDGESGVCAGDVVDTAESACRLGVAEGFLEAGTYNLCIEGLSPEGARLTGVVVAADVPVNSGDLVVVTVDLPVVPQCRNGLDDDDDGRIDDRDPGCSDDLDAAE